MKKIITSLIIFLWATCNTNAQIIMPAIFTDNMVLQRDVSIPVWGWAKSGEKIEIRFNKQVKVTRADKTGKWMVKLDAESAGGPYEMTVMGKTSNILKNVMVGEVWLCSGQSNMEYPLSGVLNSKKEIATANYPNIRQIKIQHRINSLPVNDVVTKGWIVSDSSTVSHFSAVAYFFARTVHESTNIPIGIIDDTWSGSNIETWISREGFESSDEFKEMIAKMPRMNLDSITNMMVNSNTVRIEKLQKNLLAKLNPKDLHKPDFDDSRWPTLYLPKLWEEQSIGDLDGVVWLRKTITLTAPDVNKNASLELSTIDDNDVTYVNGVKVGEIEGWDTPRIYTISPGILVEGKNVISIRIVDNGGGGGVYGDSTKVKLTLGDTKISLAGMWKWQVESIMKGGIENSLPSLCYNAMINPLVNYAIRGILWYQGESNASRAYQYRKALSLLITDWRQKWNNPTMPFYFVQMPTFTTFGNSNEGCGWAELRESQAFALSLPNTAMVVTTDVGTPNDIHPANKLPVGKRLAAAALNNIYGKTCVFRGPTFKSMEVNGNEVTVSFDNIGSGLYTPDKYGYVRGFEIAGADSVFYYAKASIKNDKIILQCDSVKNPIAIHFSWIGDASESNLFNKEGFPAEPFRTDQWKTVTKNEKYDFHLEK